MKANRASTIELPRKSGGAFFQWETPGEPIAVHFQLNIVDLLERDLGYGHGKGRAGILLGRIDCGRKLTLIVEDYDSTASLAPTNPNDPILSDHELLAKLVDRWSSKSEKRISILGFYRTCPRGKVAITNDDLKTSRAHLTEPERIFLLIEPQVASVSRATLYMLRDGAVAWQWHSVPFNRKELTQEETAVRRPISTLPEPASKIEKRQVAEKPDVNPQPEKQSKSRARIRWAIGIATAIVIVAGGVYSLRDTRLFRALSGSPGVSTDPQALGLKIQRVGTDWQLSWNSTAPILREAAVGHLSITDGFIHKNLDLDMNGLRSGSIMYTPVSDDATMHLEIVNSEAAVLTDGTVRIVAGMLPSPPNALKSIDRLPDPRVRSDRPNSTPPASNSGGESPTLTQSPSTKPPIPLGLSSPKVEVGHEPAARPEEPSVPAAIPVPQLVAGVAAQPTLAPPPPAPVDEVSSSGSILNSSVPSISRRNTLDMIKPAVLIKRREPTYPAMAKMSHLTGAVEVQLHVSAAGKVEDVTVVSGPSLLVPAAVEAVKSWQYKPAQIKGIPVVSVVSTSIVFKLN